MVLRAAWFCFLLCLSLPGQLALARNEWSEQAVWARHLALVTHSGSLRHLSMRIDNLAPALPFWLYGTVEPFDECFLASPDEDAWVRCHDFEYSLQNRLDDNVSSSGF